MLNPPIPLVIFGASGRNGKRLVDLATQDPKWALTGAVVGSSSPSIGVDAGVLAGVGEIGLPISDQWPSNCAVAIDFSNPAASQIALKHCREHGIPLVIATTGFSELEVDEIHRAALDIPICFAPNMSVAVNVTMKLVEHAARSLAHVSGGVDVEIIERHHRMKEDSPSGTALKFGEIVSKGMGIQQVTHGRHGMVGKRPQHEIGYHAVRIGDDAGQHTICFGMMGEIVELRVAASNRDPYATGALMAAHFLTQQKPGLYSMFEVLGL